MTQFTPDVYRPLTNADRAYEERTIDLHQAKKHFDETLVPEWVNRFETSAVADLLTTEEVAEMSMELQAVLENFGEEWIGYKIEAR